MKSRWGSTYLMIERVVELRPHLEDMADVGNKKPFITNAERGQAISLMDLLKKAFLVTKAIQFEYCSPGYFYK